MSLENLTTLLGWCSVLNGAVLVLTTIALCVIRSTMLGFHSKVLALDEESLKTSYFQYLSIYKVLFLVFNLVPYIALKLMA